MKFSKHSLNQIQSIVKYAPCGLYLRISQILIFEEHLRDQLISIYTKILQKLTFLTPRNVQHARILG